MSGPYVGAERAIAEGGSKKNGTSLHGLCRCVLTNSLLQHFNHPIGAHGDLAGAGFHFRRWR